MRVEDIGDHNLCFVPGGRSLMTIGMPGVTNTSHFSGVSPVGTPVISLSPLSAELTERGSLLPLFPRNPLLAQFRVVCSDIRSTLWGCCFVLTAREPLSPR